MSKVVVVIIGGLCLLCWARPACAAERGPIDFDREIRPILSSHCFRCHGPDEDAREADLRLDTRAGLLGAQDGKRKLIVPKDATNSELHRRISAADVEHRMPPADAGKPLAEAQIELIRAWIEQGAIWRGHWAFERLERPRIPTTDASADVDNPIDRFLMERWKEAGLRPAAPADVATLKRRLNFDLIGLPPAFDDPGLGSGDAAPEAHAQYVEALLASPRFGERMAVYWLDLVRYADSCGYHSDVDQQVSPYRDYVIRAFNGNLPFDRFTREQLAGDLLPESTLEQRIATTFNRLNKATEEGGAQEGEYLAKAFADRVRTVSGTWLAATFGCAECHDHKFDPITAKDFYALGAFFADVKEKGVYSGNGPHEPSLALPTSEQAAEAERLGAQLSELKGRLQATPAPAEEDKTALDAEIKELERRQKELERGIARTLVTVSAAPREIRILPRGDWLDRSGPIVEPGFPSAFAPPEAAGRRLTRLDLADWLVHRDNPLTARVFVNRLWKLFFGAGLAKNLDDFGAQGEAPTHPELLEWLAVEFIESGWDIKHLVRLMVTTRAYRLSSVPTPELAAQDPQNRFFARQSRWRLDAEFVRDNALATSGLLVERLGGPSVKPYQPDGYWEFLNFPKRTWQASVGENQFRRGLYTHWQRTFLHPSLLAFDASTREECTADRPASNTPKSALALLNDPTFVEAARAFAARIMKEGGDKDRDRLAWAWRTALGRAPEVRELDALATLLESNRTRYRGDATAAQQLSALGQSPVLTDANRADLAAWTAVARAILNLHEFTTRN